MLYRISVTERGLTGIANIFRSRLSRLDDLLGAGFNMGGSGEPLAHGRIWSRPLKLLLPALSRLIHIYEQRRNNEQYIVWQLTTSPTKWLCKNFDSIIDLRFPFSIHQTSPILQEK